MGLKFNPDGSIMMPGPKNRVKAVEKIEKAGGQVVRLSGPTPVEEKKKKAKAKD